MLTDGPDHCVLIWSASCKLLAAARLVGDLVEGFGAGAAWLEGGRAFVAVGILGQLHVHELCGFPE